MSSTNIVNFVPSFIYKSELKQGRKLLPHTCRLVCLADHPTNGLVPLDGIPLGTIIRLRWGDPIIQNKPNHGKHGLRLRSRYRGRRRLPRDQSEPGTT